MFSSIVHCLLSENNKTAIDFPFSYLLQKREEEMEEVNLLSNTKPCAHRMQYSLHLDMSKMIDWRRNVLFSCKSAVNKKIFLLIMMFFSERFGISRQGKRREESPINAYSPKPRNPFYQIPILREIQWKWERADLHHQQTWLIFRSPYLASLTFHQSNYAHWWLLCVLLSNPLQGPNRRRMKAFGVLEDLEWERSPTKRNWGVVAIEIQWANSNESVKGCAWYTFKSSKMTFCKCAVSKTCIL